MRTARPSPSEIEALVCARSEARTTGNWELADEIRAKLDGWGFEVQDAPDGSTAIVDISNELAAMLEAEMKFIDRVFRRGQYTGDRKAGIEGIAVLLRRAAKKDNLPHLKRTLMAALQYFEQKDKSESNVDPGSEKVTAQALLNIGNINKKTALHFAAQNAGPNMLRFLLRRGSNVNAHCTRGQTPICFAIAKRRYRNAEVLLEAGASLMVRTVLGETPLDLAVAHVALPRRDLVHRMKEALMKEISDKTKALEESGEDGGHLHPCGGRVVMWRDFTEDENAIANQLEHARSCENCKANARALNRGVKVSVTSIGSGKRRLRRHFDFDFDDASDADEPAPVAELDSLSIVDSSSTNESSNDRDSKSDLPGGNALTQRCTATEYTQRHGKIRKAAANPSGDEDLHDLLLAGRTKWGRDHANYLSLVESPSPGSGRTALMMASWRGHINNVKLLLDEGASINCYTKRSGNYGKTPIFYACTRCRDEVVLLLLSRGADALIVNNKGQTPRSLAVSHLRKETTIKVAEAEAMQLASGRKWSNFRASHSDGVAYGDLDVRFLDADNLRGRGGWDIIGASISNEDKRSNSVGGPQDPATGSHRRWEGQWEEIIRSNGDVIPFPPPTTGGVCVRPTKRYAKRRPFEAGEKSSHETRLKHAIHVKEEDQGTKSHEGIENYLLDKMEGVDGCGSQRSILLPWASRWLEQESAEEAALEKASRLGSTLDGVDSALVSISSGEQEKNIRELMEGPLLNICGLVSEKGLAHDPQIEPRLEEGKLADTMAFHLCLKIRRDLGRSGNKSAYLKIMTEVKDLVVSVASRCIEWESETNMVCQGYRVMLCLANVTDLDRIKTAVQKVNIAEENDKIGKSRRSKKSVRKTISRLQRVTSKLLLSAIGKVLCDLKLGSALLSAAIWEVAGSTSRKTITSWVSNGTLKSSELEAAGVPEDVLQDITALRSGSKKTGQLNSSSSKHVDHEGGSRFRKNSVPAFEAERIQAVLGDRHICVSESFTHQREPQKKLEGSAVKSRYLPLRLSLESDSIRTVQSGQEATTMVEYFKREIERSANGVLLGIDTEWGDDDKGCALVQIATVDTVYLIDLMMLRIDTATHSDEQPLVASLRWIMCEARLIKIGFSFSHDWDQLEKVAPGVRSDAKSVFDLQTFIHNKQQEEMPHMKSCGLSSVVQKYLGLPLDKTEQCSDWCSRPLRKSQIRYAALDALILVDLTAVLCLTTKMASV